MTLKHCTVCKLEKPLKEFYKSSRAKDSRQSQCKRCTNTYAQTPESKKYRKEYNRSAEFKEASDKYCKNNPEKVDARKTMHKALCSGKLTKPENCTACGQTCTPDGHHSDYSKPLEVVWLCRPCHSKEHVHLKEIEQLM